MVSKGFYVHYKGGIYFVTGIAANGDSHDWKDQYVIYESTQGCGDDVAVYDDGMISHIPVLEASIGARFRTAEDFTCMVDWATGLSDQEALLKGVHNKGQSIPRFQRIVGWKNGRPLVTDPDGRDGRAFAFVPQITNPTGIYQGGE